MQMNRIGILGDAVDYINELLVKKQKLEDELNGINEIECRDIAAEEESAIANLKTAKVSSKLNKKLNKNEVFNIELQDHLSLTCNNPTKSSVFWLFSGES